MESGRLLNHTMLKCRRAVRNGRGVEDLELKGVFDPESPSKDGRFSQRVVSDMTVFCHRDISGCYVLRSAVSLDEQVKLFHSCWFEFPEPPSSTNLTAHYGSLPELALSAEKGLYLQSNAPSPKERWSISESDGPSAISLLQKLRWSSLGPHYDWTSRCYDTSRPYRPLPASLISLWHRFASLAYQMDDMDLPDCHPDVALVNYYSDRDALGGHKDDAEHDLTKPIVCLSLGLPGIFLMGGESRAVEPTPILLRSGDVVVMHHEARRCVHGLARVWTNDDDLTRQEFLRHWHINNSDMKLKTLRRISVSVRSL